MMKQTSLSRIADNGMSYHLLYSPKTEHPMSVIVFASGGGGNLKTAIKLAKKEPSLVRVDLVVTDRLKIRAISIAKQFGVPVIARDFEKECGIWSEYKNNPKKTKKYQNCAVRFHDRILGDIQKLENERGRPFDLVVLSYHRWIHGKLLTYFRNRMINQHAGDLTVTLPKNPHERRYRGINPVFMALKVGEKRTRSSTFLVTGGHDTGEILCQGPWVEYSEPLPITKESAWKHELKQKRESDWPTLSFALKEIAKGNFGIATDTYHPDGSRVVFYKGKALPYDGVDLESNYD